MFKKTRALVLLIAITLPALPSAAGAKKSRAREEIAGKITVVLWQKPADIASRNLLYGPGGKQHEPRPPFVFLKEDLKQHNPKFEVRDAAGVKWTVKLGPEARPETAATRLVWAAGYFATEDYFVRELRVENLPPVLSRGQEFVSPGGVVRNVRLKRSPAPWKKTGDWRWRQQPFSHTREFNGLRVMMALINNWDLKDENNAVFECRGDNGVVRIYLVSDVGSSFGTTGAGRTDALSKGNLDSYTASRFIREAGPQYVDFTTPTRASLRFLLPQLPYFIGSLRLRWIGRHIPREDARWIGTVLERLSPSQIRDAFLAAGYSKEDADGFARVVERRITALREL